MATSKRTKQGATQPSGWSDSKPTFIEPHLTKQDKEQLAKLFEKSHWGIDAIVRLVDSGYKFSWGTDDRGGGYKSTLAKLAGGTMYILTGRGSTPAGAMYALLYRHEIMLEGEWDLAVDTGGDEFFA